jgi:hypothetical protein
MLFATGCIVADPPQYEEPRRTAPLLDLSRAQPSPFWIIVVDRRDNLTSNDVVDFKVPFRSDDQGESVFSSIHIDYKSKSSDSSALPNTTEAPSTFDDVSRAIERRLGAADLRGSPGCHQLTLLAAHQSSWDNSAQQPFPDAPADDIAVATWWLHLDPEPGADPYTLPDCPNQTEVEQ